MAHQAGAYPGFYSVKRLGVFLLSPGWDASPLQGYPQAYNLLVSIYFLGGERHRESKVSSQEHKTVSLARARTQTARSGVERTNHDATTPPILREGNLKIIQLLLR